MTNEDAEPDLTIGDLASIILYNGKWTNHLWRDRPARINPGIYDMRPCRGVYVPEGMTREQIDGTAKIIAEMVEEWGGVELSRYLATNIARQVINYLQPLFAAS
jgi:hypothetical protein